MLIINCSFREIYFYVNQKYIMKIQILIKRFLISICSHFAQIKVQTCLFLQIQTKGKAQKKLGISSIISYCLQYHHIHL